MLLENVVNIKVGAHQLSKLVSRQPNEEGESGEVDFGNHIQTLRLTEGRLLEVFIGDDEEELEEEMRLEQE